MQGGDLLVGGLDAFEENFLLLSVLPSYLHGSSH